MASYGSGLPAVVSRVDIRGSAGGVTELDVVGEAQLGNQQAVIVGTQLAGNNVVYINELVTDTTQNTNSFASYVQADPSSNSARANRAAVFQAETAAANGNNLTSLAGAVFNCNHRGTGTITNLVSQDSSVNVTTTGTATNSWGNRSGVFLAGGGTMTTQYAYHASFGSFGAGIVTSAFGYFVAASLNSGGGTYTREAGVCIAALTAASNSSAIVIGQTTIPDGDWAIYSASGNDSQFAGKLDLSPIAAGSPALKITATSDTPTVAFTGGGSAPTTAPAGYLEILVGSDARYIPFWA